MVWIIGIIAYLLFRLWYDNWRGALKPAEIDGYLEKLKTMADSPTMQINDSADLETILREDDGKEFIILNLVKLHDGSIPRPDNGEEMKAMPMLNLYSQPFMKAMFRRAGHPVLMGRPISDHYVDAWGVEDSPGWNIVGMVRYRSRRDMAQLFVSDQFTNIHKFKIAAIDKTLNVPFQPRFLTFMGPRYSVALIIAFICALVS